ncbi:hypothetical protein [Arcicella aurantiaca]|nr:hypothetical protein [Arcicella aurantiaca]
MDSSNMDSSNMDSSNKRLSFNEMAKLVKASCSNEYKSAEEIAVEINRAVKYLKNFILPKLIENGELIKLFPDNNPFQKYKSNIK